ncbi:DUF4242 domain-containing protein [Microbacterium sp. P01]|uniref:DUF4242 domain-containing protein n=1 Tax=unclassified Microbacterium TaxID=2609290 RepID=UPI00366A8260
MSATEGIEVMPYYVIERNFADALEVPLESAADVKLVNDEEDVRWLFSFLSVDRRKTYCLYEAASPEAIRSAAAHLGIPADAVIEVAGRLMPDGMLLGAE